MVLRCEPLVIRTAPRAALARGSIPSPDNQTTVETTAAYLDRLASADPTPGGGSAACIVGALGVALLAMVARVTLGSAKLAPQHPEAAGIATEADALRRRFTEAAARDEQAFAAVMTAQKLPRATEAEKSARRTALQTALTTAAAEPLQVAQFSLDALRLARRTLALGNTAVASDIACGAEFALAALRASAFNVRINHHYMSDRTTIDAQATHLTDLEEAATNEATTVITAVRTTI